MLTKAYINSLWVETNHSSFLIELNAFIYLGWQLTIAVYVHVYFLCDLFFIAPAFSKVRYRGSTFRPFVRSFVRSSVRPSTICVESGNKLYFFAAVVAVRMKPCIVTLQAGTLTLCP